MGQARVVISSDFLAVMLFPEGAKIVRIREEPDSVVSRGFPNLEVVVDHPDLPEVEQGSLLPQACPRYKPDSLWMTGADGFLDWGIMGTKEVVNA